MILRLQAQGFRNLATLDWRPDPGVHFLFGDTGQGKTSLIEALYVVCTTRSFRTARLAQCVRRNRGSDSDQQSAEHFWLQAEVEEPSGAQRRLELSWGSDGLQRRLDEVAGAPLAEVLAVQPIVNWSSADLETLVGAPELRRRLLDRGVVSHRPATLMHFTTLRRALAQKRALLQTGRAVLSELRPWNELIAAAALEIVAERRRYVERLQSLVDQAMVEILPEWGPLELSYRPSLFALDTEGALELLERESGEEIRRRRALLGPHRDRMAFRWSGWPLAEMASAGERKVLGLLLTLCQVRSLQQAGRPPVLLLDDLDVEMDQHLLAALKPLLNSAHQTFVTSNRPAAFRGLFERLAEVSDEQRPSRLEERPEASDGTSGELVEDMPERSPSGHFSWAVQDGTLSPS